ncbi:MAG: S46 family peptidase, partial [Rhodothermales bacterium]|nr:S46 family peptidase [Rhodothermales bacterium]
MKRFLPLSLLFVLVLSACTGSGETVVTSEPTPVGPTEMPAVAEAEPAAPDEAPAVDLAAAPTLDPDTVTFSRYDTGRMWTFDNPPTAYLRETYDFTADAAWFERARLGALRFATWCSASFVSPNGLILTNHHCARSSVTEVSEPGEELHETGFYAEAMADERRVEDLFVEQLIEIVDVTAEVDQAVMAAETDAERVQARQAAVAEAEERLLAERGGEEAGFRVQVIEFYSGGQYSAYVFRRYDDVRLAFAPEDGLGFFGGDPDNFTYPRYSLDYALFRAYDDDGEPLDTSGFYFPWSENGTEPGDLVFVIGNPGTTTRLQTTAELEFRRDVQEPAILRLYATRADAYEAFTEAYPEDEATPEARDTYFSLSNARKKYTGHVEGLRDPYIIARKRAAEREFRAAVEADPALQAEYGDVFDAIAQNRQEARGIAAPYGAFLGLNPGSSIASNVLTRALFAYGYGQTQNDRLREAALSAEEDRPEALEEALLEARLEDVVFYYGADSDLVRQVLGGRTPEQVAEALVEASAFATVEGTEAALDAGSLDPAADPALAVAAALFPEFMRLQQQAGALGAQRDELSARLARARFQVYGTDIPPDATFSLRINDGVVKGYPYNGTVAPPYTTFWGLYDHYYSYRPSEELDEFFDLPDGWLPIPDELDLETPMNFVTTNDIIGGNSGSPMLNRDLEIVGVAFDGNIQSLPGNYIYLPEQNRTVGVDSRGM